MKKAIIFGITGQDGSYLADFLLDDPDYTVVGVARRTSNDSNARIKHILSDERFELVEGDITDAHSVIHILQTHANVDEVYNLAAQSHVAVSFKQPALTWDITGKGCLNILQSLVDLKMAHVKFYQASSSEMFGKNYDEELVPLTPAERKGECSDLPKCRKVKYQDENTKFMPQSPYAIAKCAAHYMTALYRDAYGMHASAGILFNHEGPRRGENFVTRKISKWIGDYEKWREAHDDACTYHGDHTEQTYTEDNIVSAYIGAFPKLRLGNLEAFRDWGFAGDYVEAMWMMLQQDSPEDYVICTGETHTIREFLDVAFSHIGIDDWSELVVQDPEFYRPAEVDYLRGVNSKAKKQLGWEPKTKFEDLVKLMVNFDTTTRNG
jgi:GDPmannose 4,6-dehydratase